MSVPSILVSGFVLVASILGPDPELAPPEALVPAKPRPQPSPFESRTAQEPTDPVDRFYHRALRFKDEALFLGGTETGRRCLAACGDLMKHVVALEPDRCDAYLLWGESLFLQARFNPDPEPRLELIASGTEIFRQAETCAGVSWNLYRLWGEGLAMLAYRSSFEPAVRLKMMREAVEVLQRGAAREDLAGNRGDLLRSGGFVTVILAENQEAADDRIHWYRQVVKNYEEAQRLGVEIPLYHQAAWTEALYDLSDLTGDRDLARQAVEHGKRCVELSPNSLAMRYNLACAYAVLGEPFQAIRHLEICVAGDRKLLSRAQNDPVLRHLRATGEYAAFLETINSE